MGVLSTRWCSVAPSDSHSGVVDRGWYYCIAWPDNSPNLNAIENPWRIMVQTSPTIRANASIVLFTRSLCLPLQCINSMQI